MKFHCLLPCRDEADIIGQCLSNLLTWADNIFLFDTGSVDNTWEIVNELALKESRVIPLRQDPVYFSETRLRGWMFNEARSVMKDGDWFLRVDADEFHHVLPPDFVKSRLQKHETIVYHQYYNFALLESEVTAWEAGKESLADRLRPIEDRRRWYTPSVYAEPRLCRYRESMRWPSTVSFPYNAGYVAKERLPIRHYPHRDPVQLERRCLLRAVMMSDKENRSNWSQPELHHWAESEWRKFVTPDDNPDLIYWRPGDELKEVFQTNHLAKPAKRLTQRFVHRFLLTILDSIRPSWHVTDRPQPIPHPIIETLHKTLNK